MRVYVALDIELNHEMSNTGAGAEAVQHALDVELDGMLLEAQSARMPFLHYYTVTVAGMGDTHAELRESITRRNAMRRQS